jgi:hypothetical protein
MYVQVPVYQWLRNGVEVPAATGGVLSLSAVSDVHVGLYTVRATNSCGEVSSDPIALTMLPDVPMITRDPSSATLPYDNAGVQLHVTVGQPCVPEPT